MADKDSHDDDGPLNADEYDDRAPRIEDHDAGYDAFNDDTFGGEASEWQEDHHEELAIINEDERRAIKETGGFFDLDDDDGTGDALEPLEEANGGGRGRDPTDLLSEALERGARMGDGMARRRAEERDNIPTASAAGGPPDDPAIVNVVSGRLPAPSAALLRPNATAQAAAPAAPLAQPPHPSMLPHPGQQFLQQRQFPQLPPGVDPRQLGLVRPPAAAPGGGMLPPPGMPPPFPQMPAHMGGPPPQIPPHLQANQQRFPPPPHLGPGNRPISAQDLERELMRGQQDRRHQQQPPPPMGFPQHQGPARHQQQFQGHHHYHHQQGPYHHQQQQYQRHGGGGGYHHHRNRNDADDKNRETFGDDFVDTVVSQQRQERNQQQQQHRGQQQYHQQHHQQHHRGGRDRDAGYSSQFDRQRGTSSLITPGHVHALDVLRHARERESTGNPHLDMELEQREQREEGWQEEYYSRAQDDPYAGLMTPRERQWIVNIQLQQLKCENPFVDDYYCTVYNQKREQAEENAGKKEEDDAEEEEEDANRPQMKRHEEGPQLLLQQAADLLGGEHGKDEYRPVQFSNSLGKLQAVTVKAPRKIIDVGVVNNDGGDSAANAQKESRNYKNTLLEIERVYQILIDVEDCEKKLAALPTNTALHKQVEEDQVIAVQRLTMSILAENRIKRYLMVRKGKTLLKRCFRHLDDPSSQLLCGTLFQLLPAAARKDREDKLLLSLWPEVKRHLRRSSLDLLQHYMRLLNVGASKQGHSASAYSTYKTALSHPLGSAVLMLTLRRMGAMYASLGEESQADVKRFTAEVWKAVGEVGEIASPVEAVAIEFRKELGECPEQKRLVAAAAS